MNRVAPAGKLVPWVLSLVLGLAVLQGQPPLAASDTALYTVKKGLRYAQTTAFQPTLDSTNGFRFQADAYPSVQGFLTNAFVKVAGSNLFTPMPLTPSETHFQFKNTKNKLTKMNLAFPSGNYLLAMYGVHDGTALASLLLQGDAYPPTPYVTNFAALGNVNPNGYCVIGWEGYGAGMAPDFQRLTVSDAAGNNVFQGPNMDSQEAWSGRKTYAIVGPGNLSVSQTYTVALEMDKKVAVNLTSYPGAIGIAAYFVETKLSLATSAAGAPDVKTVDVSKSTQWVQTNSGPAAPDPAGQYQFQATAKAYLPGVLGTGSVVLPPASSAPTTRSLALLTDGVTLSFHDTAATPSALDAAYGSGTYTVSFGTPHDGAKSLTLALGSVTNAPPPPHVANFDAAQAVDASQPFTVTWDAWSGGGPNDYVQFHIEDLAGNQTFQTPALGGPKALNPGATNALVPAGTLLAGQSYVASVAFKKFAGINVTNYPGVLQVSDYYSRTVFNLTTLPPPSPPVLTLSLISSNHLFQVAASGLLPQQAYRLDGSPSLPPQWTPLMTNPASGATLRFVDPNSTSRTQFFYRLVPWP